ncbi:cyd operon YbgE family protein [Pseudomonas sp. F1_0610]|uniref:cyd operon YbgE family protein n=1 Tax=Pseudomonas sp. F1_0610 TaxID=3114284 RepID=UPI0039C0EBFF
MQTPPVTPEFLTQPWTRVISWLLATPMCLLLLVHPSAMLDSSGSYSHSLLMFVMLGVSGGFIHGVGFHPRHIIWKLLFHPLLAWLLMLLGYGLWLYATRS